ncbi:TetR/AcrR family transcriptional regulator [Mobilicoccus massiliensis]|uniref:TetR/AcrR family transcriptional regulator n=1 Tax=Mobilicoccus massiliensis TaxID=1522310 RepID=UPI00069459EC|nr:TetR/AcrR family transcriptional regulator [Mobilicoccus massiliensis]
MTQSNSGLPASSSQDDVAISTRRLATRTRLLDATREVVAAKGVHGASVEEICEVAGFTRGAFYSNYADKDEILLDLVRRDQSRIFDPVALGGEEEGIDAMVEAVLAAVAQPDLDYFLVHAEIALHGIRTPEFAPVATATDGAMRDRIRTILAAGLARLDREPLVHLDDLAECVSAVNERSIRHAALAGERDLRRMARATLPHVLRGLTRPRQHAHSRDDGDADRTVTDDA